ncbi:MAG: hydrogenase expression/formation protein HypE [Pseudomonadota bacterium]|nr:hydrogenase expression/formation protein HypE [Pseudomonadota bacterium]
MNDESTPTGPDCPLPIADYPRVLLAHGGGGALMRQLLERMILPAFGGGIWHDAAVLDLGGSRLAFTTDSYVVKPLFFPGGDIGSLAVHGTVNDLAMAGARPLWLSASFILEEGLPMETLWRVVRSMQAAAREAGTAIVTGDTKVVDRGKGDGLYVNTAGIGVIDAAVEIHPGRVRPGDVLLVNGDLGRHGIAVMARREGLAFETAIASDSAPLAGLVQALLAGGIDIHCLRDLTRGGLASALNEIAQVCRRTIEIDETLIPLRQEVAAACELLGLDPLYVACEGRCVGFVPAADAHRALALMRAHPLGRGAVAIGSVQPQAQPRVVMTSRIGARRIVDMLSGEQLPRIC